MTFLRNNFYLLSLIFVTSFGFAQNENFTNAYGEYFQLNSESLYLHLNKTEFLPEETLRFAAYSYYTEYQQPSLPTTNLHVSIYDKNGNFLESKIIYMQTGLGSGFFELDPKIYKEGEYLIRASTNYLKNFNEDLSYLQEFRISREKKEQEIDQYELQVIPEGGIFLAGVENTVAVTLSNPAGKGIAFKGKLFNDTGDPLRLFEANRFGHSKLNITPSATEDFYIEVTGINGKKYELPVPKPSEEGLALETSYSNFGDFIFSIKTNDSTYDRINNDSFLFTIHQEGKMKTENFQISDSLETILSFRRNFLYPGINTITVFNEKNEPLLQRTIFNRPGVVQHEVKASIVDVNPDSLTVEISAPNLSVDHSLSLSILPENNDIYVPQNNILSAFQLAPYLPVPVHDAGYYIQTSYDMRKKDHDLDLLLLTQRNGKYFWKDVFNNPPREKYLNEKGFTIQGKVKNDLNLKKHRLAVIAPGQNLYEISALDSEGKFKIQNIFLLENSEISFNLINSKNERTLAEVRYQIIPKKQYKDLPKATLSQKELTSGQLDKNNPFGDPGSELPTVSLEEKKEKMENPPWHTEAAEDINHTFVIDYIRNKGFKIHEYFGVLHIYSKNLTLEKPNGISPIVTVNGMRLSRFYNDKSEQYVTNLSSLENLKVSDLESIKVDKTGAGQGSDGAGGLIEIELKEKDYDLNSDTSTPVYKAYTGFSADKKFIIPDSLLRNQNNHDSMCVGWFPDLRLKNGKKRIKILNTGQSVLKLVIQGMALDGGLIAEEFTLSTKN